MKKSSVAVVCEAVYDEMMMLGLDEESDLFAEIFSSCVQSVQWGGTPLNQGSRRSHYVEDDGDTYHSGFRMSEVAVYMAWRMWLDEVSEGDLRLCELLDRLTEVGQQAKDEWEEREREDGVSAAAGDRSGADAADTTEPAGDANVSGDRASGGGCVEPDPGQAQEELLGDGGEDRESETDWATGAAAVGPESECGDDVGIPGEGSGKASDETGRVERRKTSFGCLPPPSKYSSTYRSQSLCGGAVAEVW